MGESRRSVPITQNTKAPIEGVLSHQSPAGKGGRGNTAQRLNPFNR